MEPLRVGLIGCGVIGHAHAKALEASDKVEFAAVSDLLPERCADVADKHDVFATYASGQDLIEQADVEAVILAFPAATRTELGLQALRKGRHLLTEKPVAMNAREVEQLIAARGGLKAACCSSRFRYTASAKAATEFLAGGGLGRLRTVRCKAHAVPTGPPNPAPPTWRLRKAENGGGILLNWGCYDLDYLLGLTGWSLGPEKVFANVWTVPPAYEQYAAENSDAETHITALVRCRDGVTLTYERAEFLAAPNGQAWSITGEQGTLTLGMLDRGEASLVVHRPDLEKGAVAETIWSGPAHEEWIQTGPIEDLAAAVREDREPSTSLERAWLVQRLSDAIYESAASGEAVEIGTLGG